MYFCLYNKKNITERYVAHITYILFFSLFKFNYGCQVPFVSVADFVGGHCRAGSKPRPPTGGRPNGGG